MLYDGLKNFLLIPLLLRVRRRGASLGCIAALFVLLYAGLRIPIDLLREYPVNTLGLPTGQGFNVIMATIGVSLLVRNYRRARRAADVPTARPMPEAGPAWRPWALGAVMAVALVIPSDATRDIPSRYGQRHPGLQYSTMYPRIPGH